MRQLFHCILIIVFAALVAWTAYSIGVIKLQLETIRRLNSTSHSMEMTTIRKDLDEIEELLQKIDEEYSNIENQ